MALDALETSLVEQLRLRASEMEARLEKLVDTPSFTTNCDQVSKVANICREWMAKAGFSVEATERPGAGTHLFLTRGARAGGLLWLGHTDTVYPPGHAVGGFRPDPEDPERLFGPGVTDMKGGLVVMMAAAEVLARAGLIDPSRLSLFLCADEETGSPTGKALVRRAAADHELCLVFETGTARADGHSTIVTARKGCRRYRFTIEGVESHAGARKGEGLSAIEEAAHKILALEALNDPEAGTTVNVGRLEGGSTVNTVAGRASFEVDTRFRTKIAGEALDADIRRIAQECFVVNALTGARARTSLECSMDCPPMEPTPASLQAAADIAQVAEDLGRSIEMEYRGGVSDGNSAADAGCPTVDGLGTLGGKIHSQGEWVLRRSLVERAELLAVFAKRWLAASASRQGGANR